MKKWKERWLQEGAFCYISELGLLLLESDGWHAHPAFFDAKGETIPKSGPHRCPREAARFVERQRERIKQKLNGRTIRRQLPEINYNDSRSEFWIG